jgi:hypothetical protein
MQSLLPYFQQNFKNKEGWKDIFQALKGMEERKEERKEGRNEGRRSEGGGNLDLSLSSCS